MTAAEHYVPPRVWTWDGEAEASLSANRPSAGPNHQKVMPVGEHALQLYSLATPNGQKVTILLEELLEQGISGAEYDAWIVDIRDGTQFSSGFTEINPNSKIPALLDLGGPEPIRVFESGAILVYLAEKFRAFLPSEGPKRASCLSWLFWQVGSAPFVGGGFGHFYSAAPVKLEYAINRFAMETKRQLDVLDRRLGEAEYLCGDDYTVADMAVWPWYGRLVNEGLYDAAEFLSVGDYKNVLRWTEQIGQRPAVQRGRIVNGIAEGQLRERHSASDFAEISFGR
ncbi:glutathione-dependent disulfide-bond oxidoreductase [Sphingopyxis sp.]|uniref:glutathione-dependent disulfide-bond oxidoreductase n=1 Tax=Sphingopyxis sp. TaxID=1908224 RepID=UPI002D78D3B6|nr:glutathione-dependent disulfide-bond oxidoreductase [Sphingopyxis sp.]HET6522869.1 glutathione-dependent disulfide-bond oxidoreductase [Sphingopyxis sp.]